MSVYPAIKASQKPRIGLYSVGLRAGLRNTVDLLRRESLNGLTCIITGW
ncbi:hypothetical protein [Paenibacillus alginolyticus]|uniref:Uncharacterized protein n=1 Tax=Paenibacillus alginolyticus TaxID=59839 RepID=A0ABT4GBY9_9BACL|nr:hypothetical protein [Paenibacillus alginolyticus]MCY9693639.1 hypothetical protein [Paenibacillus alginolyticus]MEC0145632.1 hypothetical protein [Paenibacillus alginolyticus]